MSDIDEHRKKIEAITLEMIKLLKTRTDIAKQIGDAKASLGMTVTDEEREDALRTQVTKLCKDIDLDQSTALKFLNLLLNESVKVQSDNKQTHLSVFLKAKALEEEGVEYIFGIPGEENLDLLNSLKDSSIKLILTRHEQAAGFMAATYGRLTGKSGVSLSTLGPGATNLVTAAAYSQLAAMPMV